MSSNEYWLVHKWTIDNFEHFYKEEWNFDRIESNKFYLNFNKEDQPDQFHLCLHPNGEKDKYANNVTLFLYRSSVQQESLNVWFQMWILDANGEKRNTRALRHVFDERHDHFGFGHYIRVINLLNKSNGLLCGDKLTLLCELHVNGHEQIKDNSISDVSESHSNAQPQVSLSLAHKWTIDNFGNIHRDQWPIHKIESEKFNSPYDAKRQFCLCLFPNGFADIVRDYMTVSLYHVSIDQTEDLSVLWKVSILNEKGQKWYTRGEQIKFTQTVHNWGMGHFITVSKLLEHSNEFLHDDKLDLFCEIKILTTEVNHITNSTDLLSLRLASNPQYNPSYDSINLSKCAHKWTIHNFSSVLSNEPSSKNSLLSRRFTSSPQKHYYFNLSILPIGHDEEGRSCVSLELHSDFFERMSLTFQMRISLIGANEMKFPFHDLRHFIESYKCHSGIAFIEKTISLDELCQNNMLNSDGSITLYCEIDAIENRGQIVLSDKEEQSYLVKLAKLKLAESQVTDSVTNATGKKVQLECTWEIEDFRKIYDYAKSLPFVSSQHSIERNFIRSPTFSPPNTNQHQFYLRLYPCGVNEEFRDCVAMGFGVMPSGKRQITSEYSISLLDSVGFKCNTRKGQMRYGGDQGFGWPRYITHEDLFNPANAFFTDNNKLMVHCAVEFVVEEEEELINAQQKQNKLDEINNISTPPITNQTVVTPTESITQVNLLIHQWTIDNFGLYFQCNQNEHSNSNYLECNKFSPVNDDQLRFVLECRPKLLSESESFEIFFDIIFDKKPQNVSVDVIISVLNENDIKCFTSRVYPFPPWKLYPEFDWKDTQMKPKSINQLKLLFSYQICTHYSSLTEMRESQQSYENLAIALNLSNKWQVKRLCDVVTHTRAATTIPVESCTYEWCIPKFCSQRQENLQSSTFSSKEHDFFLRMNKNSIESQDTALLYLCLNKSVEMETNVCLKISILDKDGHKLCTKDNLIKLFEGELQYECGKTPFDKNYFTSNGLIGPDDNLTIFVELNLVGEPTCSSEVQVPIRILPQLKSLLFNRQPIDIFLQFSDGILYAHKAVLSIQSKVFEEMYNNDAFNDSNVDKPLQIIQLDNVDVGTFEVMLRFIYTGQLRPGQVDHVFAEKLLILSDMYKVESLKSICEDILLGQLETAKLAQNIQQSVKYLLLADKHNAKRLKERCIKIVNQHAPIIRETSAWSALLSANPRVITDLYEDLVINRNYKPKKKVVTYSVK